MKCNSARYLISLLSDGRLDDGRQKKLETHLMHCSECRNAARQIEELAVSLESMEAIEPRESGWERLAARIQADEQKHAHRSPVPVFAYGFALIIVITVIALAVLTGRDNKKPEMVHQPKPSQVQIVEQDNKQSDSEMQVAAQKESKQESPAPAPVIEQPKMRKPEIMPKTAPKKHYRPTPKSKAPEPEPVKEEPEPVEEIPTVDTDYVAQAEPVPSQEITYQADQLIALGMSVLVEASLTDDLRERGDEL